MAKLHDINSQLVEEQGFLDSLKELLSDSNPMVVANAVAALSEINEASPSGRPLIEMNAATINKLLTALNECTEWGQVRQKLFDREKASWSIKIPKIFSQ